MRAQMKMLGWFGKLLLSVLLISFLSVFTTVYLVDQYVKGFIQQWDLTTTERSSLDMGDFLSKMAEPSQMWNNKNASETDLEAAEDGSIETGGSESNKEEDEMIDTAPPQGAVEASGEIIEDEEALPVFGQQATEDLKQSLVMSAEQFNEKRKKLSNEDKLAIFAIMMAKLPQEELQKMSLLLEDGITEEELNRLEEVINAYLQEEEVARLLAILNKY